MKEKSEEQFDPFVHFKKVTADAFDFLISDYGFDHFSTTVYMPECEIRYYNQTTGVRVMYEWGGLPSVTLFRLERTPTKILEPEGYWIELLIKERCPDRDERLNYESGELNDRDVERMLRNYAVVLKAYARDVLQGDFKIFPKLKALAQEEQRQRNLELFGSETGETP